MNGVLALRLDYIEFIHALCLFFLGCFCLAHFRNSRRLHFLWLALYSASMFLCMGLSMSARLLPPQDTRAMAAVLSAKGLAFFFMALFGAQGISNKKLRGAGYAFSSLILVAPVASAAAYGLNGFRLAVLLFLGFSAGLFALVGYAGIRKEEYEQSLPPSIFHLLALYLFTVAVSPGIHILAAGLFSGPAAMLEQPSMTAHMILAAVLAGLVDISLARSAAFEGRGRKEPARDKILAYSLGLTAVGAAVFLGFALTDIMGDNTENSLRQELFMRVAAVGNALDPDEVVKLSSKPEDLNNSHYKRLLLQLSKIKQSNPDLRFVYMVNLRPEDRMVVFSLDTEPPTSDNYAPPGETYDEAPPELIAVFSTGKAVLVGPYQDRWGRWLSGFAPIKNESGAVLGVVGMDISSANLFTSVSASRLLGVVITFLLGVIGAGVGLLVERNSELALANTMLKDEIEWRKRAEEKFKAAQSEAEAANQAKSRFLAAMSHEIRTPLAAISGMADLAVSKNAGPDLDNDLASIKDSAAHLMEVVDNILDLSSIEAGKMKFESRCFDLRDVTRSTEHMLKNQARAKNLELSFTIDPETPVYLRGDPVRLRQILLNLAGNAVKFTGKGSVRVSISQLSPDELEKLSAGENDPGVIGLFFKITDTGMGIPENRIPELFTAYSQVHDTRNDTLGGSGLGLSICRQLVEMMGGVINVTSKPGRGSEFSFSALFEPGDPTLINAEKKSDQWAPQEEKFKILLVEDNPANVKVAFIHLSRMGHLVTVAENGKKALEALKQTHFDLILMDLAMPEMDGLEATRLIRSGGGPNSKTPIVAMTAHALEDIRQSCAEAGMNGFLAKPVNIKELSDVIEACVRPGLTASAEPVIKSGPGQEGSAVLDTEKAIKHLGVDNELFGEIMTVTREEMASLMRELSLGIEQKDLKKIAAEAHTLKSAAATIGAESCRNLAILLNRAARSDDMKNSLELHRQLQTEYDKLAVRLADWRS